MNWTLIYMTCHIVGILAFQQTEDSMYLYLNLAVMAYALFQFIKVGVLVLSPNWEVELSYAEHIPYSWKFLHNATQGFSIYMFYVVGWELIAGFSALYFLITTLSILITVLNVDMGEIDGDDE